MSNSPHARFCIAVGVLCLILMAFPDFARAQKEAFSVQDSLRIKSFSPQAVTDDGRYIAGTISKRSGRLGTDHKRYRDPTYISPRPAEVVILDTDTATFSPVLDSEAQVQGHTRSSRFGFMLEFTHGLGQHFAVHLIPHQLDMAGLFRAQDIAGACREMQAAK